MAYHVFVAMPFGNKEGIDFNKIYSDLIKPALESVGFEVFRADEEMRAGDIRTDMFQELLLADLVVADLSIDNPNSWYDRKVSPVYHLLPYLKEPDWKSLRVEEAKEFWDEYDAWAMRIDVARRRNRPGDILVLADEAPTRVFRVEAYRTAGKALLS